MMIKKPVLTLLFLILACAAACAQTENTQQCPGGDIAKLYLEGPHASIADTGSENDDLLSEARQIAAENSTGIHNAAAARESLKQAAAFPPSASEQAVGALGAGTQPPGDEVPPARRFPWGPLLLGIAVVVGTLAYFTKRRSSRS